MFLLSTPRAGSTLLSVLLDQFPGVLCPPEPWFLLRLLSLNGPGNPHAAFNDEFATIGTREFLGDRISRDAIRAFAVCVYNEKLSAAGQSRFVDKTPRYFHILPEIADLFPDARFIWLQRNPLDVAASYKTTWNLPPEDLFRAPARSETLDFVHGLDAFIDFFAVPSRNKLLIRYEDLVNDPSAILARLARFLDVAPTSTQLSGAFSPVTLAAFQGARVGDPKVLRTSEIHSASVDQWRSTMTPTEVRLILDHLGQTPFRVMGYTSVVEDSIAEGWMPPAENLALERRKALGRTLPKRAPTEAQMYIDQLLAQVAQLAATCHEQAEYIGTLKQEVERTSSSETALRADCAHYTQVINEQISYITALEQQLRRDF